MRHGFVPRCQSPQRSRPTIRTKRQQSEQQLPMKATTNHNRVAASGLRPRRLRGNAASAMCGGPKCHLKLERPMMVLSGESLHPLRRISSVPVVARRTPPPEYGGEYQAEPETGASRNAPTVSSIPGWKEVPIMEATAFGPGH